MAERPPPCDSVTCLPGEGRFCASLSVTVMVDALAPSGGTLVGDALMLALAAGGATKLTGLGAVRATLSPETCALKFTSWIAVPVTVNTIAPLAEFVTPLDGTIMTLALGFALKATVLPLKVLPAASRSTAITYSGVLPSAGTPPSCATVSTSPTRLIG